MRPVLAGHFKLHELQDGTYDLCAVALMNDAMDVQEDNKRLAAEAADRAAKTQPHG